MPARTASLFGDTRPTPVGGVYVHVAVERGIDRAGTGGNDWGKGATLTYSAPAALPVGRRVEVPLGRGGKTVVGGIVVASGGAELLGGLDPERVKPIVRDAGSGLPSRLVELARWMAGYYVCPLGMVLATMMPAAVKKGTGVKSVRVLVRASEAAATAAIANAEEPAKRGAEKAWARLAAIEAGAFPISPKGLAARLEFKTTGPLKKLVELGLLEVRVERVVGGGTGVPPVFVGQCASGSAEAADTGGTPVPPGARGAPVPPLTAEQARAVEGIVGSLGSFGVHLLRGVTGSGKTEVYLRVIAAALERGLGAIVLVPEIALTPQTAGRFTQRFGGVAGGGVAVLHSGLSAGARHGEWDRISRGAARVVVGARSAIFAPLPDRGVGGVPLGVIVVDEEHDSSYKQDQLPRYQGRDVAIKRGQLEGCPVILGSATPSLESWANAIGGAAKGAGGTKYRLWELPTRVGGAALPPVEVVDMAQERRRSRMDAGGESRPAGGPPGPPNLTLVGPTLDGAIRRTLEDKGQVILLLNRRGFAHYLTCRDSRCGWVCGCEHCDASLVLHRADWFGGTGVQPVSRGSRTRHSAEAVDTGGTPVPSPPPAEFVRCHHCLEETRVPRVCAVCGKRVGPLSAGTQRAEEEVGERYGLTPGMDLLRVDSDSMRTGRDYFDALSRFGTGEVRVLLGTQMVAKGLDFPNVRLVGVLDADTAANLPDFRAAERTFQLVSQVAGRAGRPGGGAAGGRVIVQTLNPGMSAIRLAAAHDFVGFATQELGLRTRAGLPPATKMARVVVRDVDVGKAERHAQDLGVLLAAEAEKAGLGVRMLGPAPAPIARIAGHHRFAIELIAKGRGDLQALLAALRGKGQLKSDAQTAVDVDPVALM